MPLPHPSTSLPPEALQEYHKIADCDWETGVPLTGLLERTNRVAVHLAPEGEGRDSRVSRTFTERSFRHYATLGCIDPPEKEGRSSVYRFRHLVQALLVRKLLWQRVPSEQIASVMSGRGTEELKRMLLEGIELVARGGGDRNRQESPAPGMAETWRRVQLRPGVELHVRGDLPRLRQAELRRLLERVEIALKGFR
ncbi:MAG: MerR family transcriptional regulator [Verrucomicrobiales bacterium]